MKKETLRVLAMAALLLPTLLFTSCDDDQQVAMMLWGTWSAIEVDGAPMIRTITQYGTSRGSLGHETEEGGSRTIWAPVAIATTSIGM